jgi:cold shock CspA family protein
MRHIQGGGKFGFIKPDDGSADILALPPRTGFPTIGARVTFDTATDDKSGRPKADNIQVVEEAGAVAGGLATLGSALGPGSLAALGDSAAWQLSAYSAYGPVIAAQLEAAAALSSPYGAAGAAFTGIAMDKRQQGPVTQPGDSTLLGTISKVSEKFAFIKQDSGEADMFVIPPACEAFGRELPPVGTRVQYKVIMDSKSGRSRADSVGPSLVG